VNWRRTGWERRISHSVRQLDGKVVCYTQCLLYPQKRTLVGCPRTSAKCYKRTFVERLKARPNALIVLANLAARLLPMNRILLAAVLAAVVLASSAQAVLALSCTRICFHGQTNCEAPCATAELDCRKSCGTLDHACRKACTAAHRSCTEPCTVEFRTCIRDCRR
jgi:hypothetical protein